MHVSSCGNISIFIRKVPCSNLRQNTIKTEKNPPISRVVDYANNRPLGCDMLYSFRYIPKFQTTLLPQSSGRLTPIAPTDSSNVPIYIHHSTNDRIPKDGRLHKHRRVSLKSRCRDWANQTKPWPLLSASCPANTRFFHHRLCIVWATEKVVKQTANKTTCFFLLSYFLKVRQATLPVTEPCLLYIMFNIQGIEAPENTNRISMQDRVRRTLLCVTAAKEQLVSVTRAAKCLHFQLDIWIWSVSLRYATQHIR
jgi:hypothetical protein